MAMSEDKTPTDVKDAALKLSSPGVLLGAITLFCALLISSIWWLTETRIKQSEQNLLRDRLIQILPITSFDNDIHLDTLTLATQQGDVGVYLARKASEPVAAIYDVTTGRGYSGEIRLLVGILLDGSIAGVRVLSHKETPGLGDDIDISRSDWISGFNAHSLRTLNGEQWQVQKDGGQFDQFTGATITPRAVVNAVYETLKLHQQHAHSVFQP